MRFDQVDRRASTPGRIGYAKLEQGIDIAAFGVPDAAAVEKFGTSLTDRHGLDPSPVGTISTAKNEQMVNAVIT